MNQALPTEMHQNVPTAAAVSLMHLPSSAEERRDHFKKFFELREKEKAEAKRRREESAARAQRDLLGNDFHVERETMRIILTLHHCKPQKRARVWQQVQVLANDLKYDVDQPFEEEDETGPVFENTTTSRRQGGKSFGPQGVKPARRSSEAVVRTRVNMQLAQQMYELAKQGLPMRSRVGRPSNEELTAMRHVQDRLEAEGHFELQQIEHKPQAGAESEQDQQTNDE